MQFSIFSIDLYYSRKFLINVNYGMNSLKFDSVFNFHIMSYCLRTGVQLSYFVAQNKTNESVIKTIINFHINKWLQRSVK